MSTTCPVSNDLVEYLLASSGDEVFARTSAFEFYHSSKDHAPNTLEAALAVTRCLDNPDCFIIGNLKNFEIAMENGVQKYVYELRPVKDFIDFLGFKGKELPVFDESHIGPFDGETTLKILELMHACYRIVKETEIANSLRGVFGQSTMDLQIEETPPVTDAEIIRPARWATPFPQN